jgi:peptide/nickel transport system permease protein
MRAHATTSRRAARRHAGRVPVAVIIAGLILAAILGLAVLAPWIAPADPTRQVLVMRLKPPGTLAASGQVYLLGTDDLGRDLLSRILFGAQVSLMVATLSVLVSTLVGVTLGMMAAWFRGWTEVIVMRLVDIMLSIPAVLLAVLTVAVLGPGFFKLIVLRLARRCRSLPCPTSRPPSSPAQARHASSFATYCRTSQDRC